MALLIFAKILAVLSVMSRFACLMKLPCPGLHVSANCQTDLLWLSCSSGPVPAVLFQLSCNGCLVLVALSLFSKSDHPFLVSYPCCIISTIFSGSSVPFARPGCPFLAVLYRLFCQLSCPSCPVQHACPWPTLPVVLSLMSHPVYPVLTDLSKLNCQAALSRLSCPIVHDPDLLPGMCCHGCHATGVLPVFLSLLSGSGTLVLSFVSCLYHAIPAVLSRHSCPSSLLQLFLSSPAHGVVSPTLFSVLSCICCHILIVLFYLFCPGCPL
jgi:hypothetical protein